MNITEKQILEFQKIYKKEFGIKLNKAEARILCTEILDIIAIIYGNK